MSTMELKEKKERTLLIGHCFLPQPLTPTETPIETKTIHLHPKPDSRPNSNSKPPPTAQKNPIISEVMMVFESLLMMVERKTLLLKDIELSHSELTV